MHAKDRDVPALLIAVQEDQLDLEDQPEEKAHGVKLVAKDLRALKDVEDLVAVEAHEVHLVAEEVKDLEVQSVVLVTQDRQVLRAQSVQQVQPVRPVRPVLLVVLRVQLVQPGQPVPLGQPVLKDVVDLEEAVVAKDLEEVGEVMVVKEAVVVRDLEDLAVIGVILVRPVQLVHLVQRVRRDQALLQMHSIIHWWVSKSEI